MINQCRIIGVLDSGIDGLGAKAIAHIQEADLIVGGTRTLELFKDQFKAGSNQQDLTGKLTQIPRWIQEAQKEEFETVVLATGDPLCHGIAKYLMNKLGSHYFEVLPNVSTIQLACARLGISWQETKICSVHTRDTGEWEVYSKPDHGLYDLLQKIKQHDSLAVFTSSENSPDRIARMMTSENQAKNFKVSVVENIHCDDEKVYKELDISDAAKMTFSSPNVVLLRRSTERKPDIIFGINDCEYFQRKPNKGLITKREVRAVSLANMKLRSDSVVWDIGAGSGSIGLESARLCPQGHVYAIEKNKADLDIIERNRQKMGISNYSLVHGKAPQNIDQWPNPDAVFIGGSGGELEELIKRCLSQLNKYGWLVMNFVTFENLSVSLNVLKELDADWYVSQFQISRSQPILHMNRLAAENPVWVVSATQKV